MRVHRWGRLHYAKLLPVAFHDFVQVAVVKQRAEQTGKLSHSLLGFGGAGLLRLLGRLLLFAVLENIVLKKVDLAREDDVSVLVLFLSLVVDHRVLLAHRNLERIPHLCYPRGKVQRVTSAPAPQRTHS